MDQIGHQAAPSCLVACSQPVPVIAVEVFMEEDIIFEMGIRLEFLISAEYRPLSLWITLEDAHQPRRKLFCHLGRR